MAKPSSIPLSSFLWKAFKKASNCFSRPWAFCLYVSALGAEATGCTGMASSSNSPQNISTENCSLFDFTSHHSPPTAFSNPQHRNQLLHTPRRLLQRRILLRRQLDLNNLLRARRPQLYRHAHKQSLDPILPIQIHRARQNLLLIFQNRFHHLHGRRRRRIIRRPGLHQIHNLRAALPRAIHNRVNPFLRQQIRQRNPRHRRIPWQRHHIIAMSAQHKRVHVLHAHPALHRHKRAHPRRIQHARHPQHPILWEPAHPERRLSHRIQRIRHHNNDALRRVLHNLLHHRLYHVVIRLQQIVAAHSRLPRKSRRNYHHVASRRRAVIAIRRRNPRRKRVRPRNRRRLHHVQRLSCRRPLQNIRQHHVRQLQVHNPLRRSRPHKPTAHHRNLLPAHLRLSYVGTALCRLRSCISLVVQPFLAVLLGYLSNATKQINSRVPHPSRLLRTPRHPTSLAG